MARSTTAPALTAVTIKNLKAPLTGRLDVPDGGMPGLCLRVTANDVRTWTLRMRDSAGKLRRIALGPVNAQQGLAWARKHAEAMRQDVRHNRRDPKRERAEAIKEAEAKADRDKLTLGVLVANWGKARVDNKNRKPGYVAEAQRALQYAFPKAWDRPAADLTVEAVAGVLAKAKPAIAARTMSYGRACYQWAMNPRNVRITFDPFSGHEVAAVVKRERVLDDAELAEVWQASAAETGVFGSITRLLILTGQRREEVAAMGWSEVAPDLATWTVPGKRTKNGALHIVPLSDLARGQLPARGEGPVFKGEADREGATFSGWSRAKDRLDARITKTRAAAAEKAGGEPAPFPAWRLHDLRRTCATGLQRLGVRLEVTEAVLNHVSGSNAGIVDIYQRHHWTDEKRAALDLWAQHVATVVGEGK